MCDANHVFAFVLCSHRKFITLRVLDREEYEKECSFFLVLGDPVWLRRGVKGVRVKPDRLSRRCRFLCVSLLSHSFLLALRLLAVLPSLLRSLAAAPFCSVFFPLSFGEDSIPLTGAPGSEECSWGRPGAGDEERHQPPETFWERCPAAPSFNQREHPASTSKKGNAASFLSEDKTAFT